MIIDRFEGQYAICEVSSRRFARVPLFKLPPGAQEGDVLREENGQYFIDVEETAKRRARIRGKMDLLFRRGPKDSD